MRWAETFRSGAFRFSLLLAGIFATGSMLVLFTVARSIERYAVEATEGSLRSEAAILAGEDREAGRRDLLTAIDRHRRAGGEEAFRYELVDGRGRTLVDDLGIGAAKTGWGFVSDNKAKVGSQEGETLRALGVTLADGSVLVIATDTYDIEELRDRLDRFTILCGIGITLFALAGGYLVGGLFMRRLDRVNVAVGRIMAGHLRERLPPIGISIEFDRLSANLNLMLDRMGALMDGLRQVSTDIAHDLRTPLTRLRHQLEVTRETASNPRCAAGIDMALVQTDEILGIFRALLRIGTIEGGVGRQWLEPIDLSEIMDRVFQAYEPVAEDAGRTLIAQHMPDISVFGDRELLTQAMTNLIDNALGHTPPGTTIVSRLAVVEGRVVAGVADDGPGIPVDEHANVLTRFYRLDRSRAMPGSGLGLALVAAIAALHDARLIMEDNGPGLTVALHFPPTGAPTL